MTPTERYDSTVTSLSSLTLTLTFVTAKAIQRPVQKRRGRGGVRWGWEAGDGGGRGVLGEGESGGRGE